MFEKEAEEYATENWEYYEEGKNDSKELKQAYQQGAEFGYNKCKEELNHKGLTLQFDMDKTIEQNIALKKENTELKEKLETTEKTRDYWKDSSFDWRHKCTEATHQSKRNYRRTYEILQMFCSAPYRGHSL